MLINELSGRDSNTILQTASNMIRGGKSRFKDDPTNVVYFFWDDVVPGILLSDGHFYSITAFKKDNVFGATVMMDDGYALLVNYKNKKQENEKLDHDELEGDYTESVFKMIKKYLD